MELPKSGYFDGNLNHILRLSVSARRPKTNKMTRMAEA